MTSIQVFISVTPLRTRSEIDDWLDTVVGMRDGAGVTRYVGISGEPDMDVVVRSEDLDACFAVMSSEFGDDMPATMASIMELRGIFADEAQEVLSFLVARRETFADVLDVDQQGRGILDVYELIVDGLQTICESGSGVLVFD